MEKNAFPFLLAFVGKALIVESHILIVIKIAAFGIPATGDVHQRPYIKICIQGEWESFLTLSFLLKPTCPET
ncbi:hypothetical protein DSECCO2_547700 [anaerobic digester metagenome]